MNNKENPRTTWIKICKSRIPFPVTDKEAVSIFTTYGSVFLDLLENRPYDIVRAGFTGVGFEKLDKWAMEQGKINALSTDRISAAIYYILHACVSGKYGTCEDPDNKFAQQMALLTGSTCVPKSSFYTLLENLLGLQEDSVDMTLLDSAVKELVLTGSISLTRAGDEIYLALSEMYQAENCSAEEIRKKIPNAVKDKTLTEAFRKIDDAMAMTGKLLSSEQRDAVAMVLTHPFSVITGGPGTGKTQTELVLVKALQLMKPNATVRCIAPTGLAAKRMSEATGCNACTIHNLLGLTPGQSLTRKRPMIMDDLVICDEVSMLDASLLMSLMMSLSDNTSIVFVGDTAQLPSIGAGNVLAELIESKRVPVSTLTKVFRQKNNSIAFNCSKIRGGNPRLEEDASFSFIEKKSSEAIAKTVVDLYKQEAEKGAKIAVLTPYRRSTATGVRNLNKEIRKQFVDTSNTSYCSARDGIRVYEGDIVEFLKNAENIGLVNGALGTVKECGKGYCVCDFEGNTIKLSSNELEYIEPAFAQTVHKSQGQEYETCIIVVDPKHETMLSRNIVYTAISRCKKKCICVGSKDALTKAILDSDRSRRSNLGKFIDQ